MDRRIVTGGLVLLAGSLLAAALLSPVGAHGTKHVDATSAEPAIHGHNPGQGTGVEGSAPAGRGVVGTGGVGVSGDGRVGVSGRGMTGVSGSGFVGVSGSSNVSTGGIGVTATGTNGALALRVAGPSRFSTSGQGTIERGSSSETVANNAVKNGSLVLVTLLGDAGNSSLDWVERKPGEGFVVHLTRRAQRDVPFAYLILDGG